MYILTHMTSIMYYAATIAFYGAKGRALYYMVTVWIVRWVGHFMFMLGYMEYINI